MPGTAMPGRQNPTRDRLCPDSETQPGTAMPQTAMPGETPTRDGYALPMIPWQLIDRARVPGGEGELTL